MIWTDDQTKMLQFWWGEGNSGSEIAKMINSRFNLRCTRNAIIGKAYRIGLPHRATTVRKPHSNRYAKDSKIRTPRAARKLVLRCPQLIAAADLPVETDQPIRLFKLARWPDQKCKWPYETADGISFGCSHEKIPGKPYCAGHLQRAFEAPKPRREPPRLPQDLSEPMSFNGRLFA